MFKNYLKSAFRNITKDWFYTTINIAGLAISIICAILILMFVQDELAFDKHHKKYRRIYRLESNFTISGKNTLAALTPRPFAPTLMDEYPEIEEYVRFEGFGVDDILFTYGEKKFYEDNMYFTDSTVFKIFTHEFILGSPENALNEPYKIVITESFAKKYFGNENPMGEVLTTSNFGDFSVSAVIKDVPGNSHLKFDCLLSVATIQEMMGDRGDYNDRSAPSFWNISTFSYILLKENTSINSIHEKFPDFYEKYMASLGNQINASFDLLTKRLDEVHFFSDLEFDLPVGNYKYIIIFSIIGFFILLIACINYMNMATARSANRAKEVGLRKIIGAHRGLLIRQFLSESIVMAFIAFAIAIVVVSLLLPYFNVLAEKTLSFSSLFNPGRIVSILLIVILVGIVSGSYPSFYLSSFLPVLVLKGTTNPQQGKGFLRKILVVFQFIVSIGLIISTLIITGQQRFIQNKDLGFNKEDILLIPNRDTAFISNQLVSFKEELLKNPDIEAVSSSILIPPRMASKVVFQVETEEGMIELAISFSIVDHDFIDMMGIKIKEGRNFDKDKITDLTEAFIINETAAKSLGWGDNALGKKVRFGINPTDGSAQNDGKVIGVVNDFHFASIHNKIEPFIFIVSENPTLNFYIRLNEKKIPESIEFIRDKRVEFGNILPFNYFFFQDKLDDMYSSEKKWGYLFTVFSLLTIFISCLGLLGLTSFVTEQRTREIGIRKVMGASSGEIVWLLNKEFLILVLLSNFIAWPVAYIGMNRWLQDFAYRIDFGLSPFVWATAIPFLLATLAALTIALVMVSFMSIRAANANPTDAISHE